MQSSVGFRMNAHIRPLLKPVWAVNHYRERGLQNLPGNLTARKASECHYIGYITGRSGRALEIETDLLRRSWSNPTQEVDNQRAFCQWVRCKSTAADTRRANDSGGPTLFPHFPTLGEWAQDLRQGRSFGVLRTPVYQMSWISALMCNRCSSSAHHA